MVYECQKCNSPLPAGVISCPKCGETFDEAVPLDAEVPVRGWQPKPEAAVDSYQSSPSQINTPVTPKSVNRQERHPSPPPPNMPFGDKSYSDRPTFPNQPMSAASNPKAGKTSPWLVIFAILFLPITILYFICVAVVKIWKHPTWSMRTKSILTGLVAAAVIIPLVVGNVQEAQEQALQQKAAAVAKAQQEAAQRAEKQRIAMLQTTPKGRRQLAAEQRLRQLAAAEQSRQQEAAAEQTAAEQASQKAKADQVAAANAVDEQNSLGSKIEAFNAAKDFVTKTLKSPGSAKFPEYPDSTVERIGDNTYSVSSYVDSQNSFGALLRGNWTATVVKGDNDTWTCNDVNVSNPTN